MAKAKAPKEGSALRYITKKPTKGEKSRPKNLKRKPYRGQGKP
jgi:hypothetical protein